MQSLGGYCFPSALPSHAKFRIIRAGGVQGYTPPIKQARGEVARERFLPPENTRAIRMTPWGINNIRPRPQMEKAPIFVGLADVLPITGKYQKT